ncbi:MAG: SCO1664 family protein [Chloroflexota bacterium]
MTIKPTIYTAADLETSVELSYDETYDAIMDGEVDAEHGMMSWGSNYTFLVTISHNEDKFLGIYKPRMGERPLWDFPDGTLCQRETASFVLSEMLCWYLVPPTILRDGPRGMGSVQAFINHDPNEHYFTFQQNPDLPELEPQLQRMAVFDAIGNNADRKGGHCLLDEGGHIWGIDHGLTFHPASKLRTVIWDYAGKAIPDDIMAEIQSLCTKLDDSQNPHTQQLIELINRSEFAALKTRIDRLIQSGTFPMPGAGPNRPWPAV